MLNHIIKNILIVFMLYSCSHGEERTLIYEFDQGVKFYKKCDTTMFFNQSPKCDWEFVNFKEDVNNEINDFGYFKVIDSKGILFYSDVNSFGLGYGWHIVKNGVKLDINAELKSKQEYLEDSLKETIVLRNGVLIPLIDNQIRFDQVLYHYGELISPNIELPSNLWTHEVYKLDENNKLIRYSGIHKEKGVFKEDGLYFVGIPGLINCLFIEV